ncbi:DUF5808 domain-containing protein [Flavobacterium sp.]|uniref:DUF5808 domain-containing protein n=1 Tax=Flavobacterium sp. TaxID=239 RepID=UPI003792BD89
MENQDNPSQETLEKWSKDPNNWIWGIFYYNKEDKRLMPPKRIPWTGWTVNFANRNSVIFLIGFMLFFVFIVSMITRKH